MVSLRMLRRARDRIDRDYAEQIDIPALAATVWEAREFAAEAVPVHALFPASAVAAGGR